MTKNMKDLVNPIPTQRAKPSPVQKQHLLDRADAALRAQRELVLPRH